MRVNWSFAVAGLILGSFLANFAAAQTSYPMITHVSPVAVQRGKTAIVMVQGQMNFAGVYKAMFQGTGITATLIPEPAGKGKLKANQLVRQIRLKLAVAADARLGVREFRLASTLGVSSIGQLVVVDDPVVEEKGFNNTQEKANPIRIPSVVCGGIETAEDVDFFKFHAEAGQTFTFEVLCARLQDKIHDLQAHADPMLTLFDSQGREMAANDDYFFADPLLTHTFSKSGDYCIQIRDSKYAGDPRWVYALFITNKPYVTHVYPMAGNPGQKIEVEPVGSAKLAKAKIIVDVPKQIGLREIQLNVNGSKSNPTTFIVSNLPQIMEQEPNDTPQQATRVTIPCGISGRIQAKRDLDHFVFKANKSKAIRFEVKARRFGTILRSSLDSVLDIMNSKGVVLASNDDAFGKDAALVFTPPADGDYILRMRDLNSKGGPTAVYYIEADWALPDFTVRCDPDKAMIGPGSSTAWYVHLARSNGFSGPVQVQVSGLPKGVTVNALTIPANMTQGLLVLTADAKAPVDAAHVEISATGSVKQSDGTVKTLIRKVTPNQEIYFPGGGRGFIKVEMQTVAVTAPSDILKVDVKPQEIILKPDQEIRIDVNIFRRKDYDKIVSLDILLEHLGQVFGNPLPPGVTVVSGKSKTLLGTGSQGYITIKAAGNAAPIEKVPISVLAHVSINFVVKVSYSSRPILLTILSQKK